MRGRCPFLNRISCIAYDYMMKTVTNLWMAWSPWKHKTGSKYSLLWSLNWTSVVYIYIGTLQHSLAFSVIFKCQLSMRMNPTKSFVAFASLTDLAGWDFRVGR